MQFAFFWFSVPQNEFLDPKLAQTPKPSIFQLLEPQISTVDKIAKNEAFCTIFYIFTN